MDIIYKTIQTSENHPFPGIPKLVVPIVYLKRGREIHKKLVYKLKKTLYAKFIDDISGKPFENYVYRLDTRTVPKLLRKKVA